MADEESFALRRISISEDLLYRALAELKVDLLRELASKSEVMALSDRVRTLETSGSPVMVEVREEMLAIRTQLREHEELRQRLDRGELPTGLSLAFTARIHEELEAGTNATRSKFNAMAPWIAIALAIAALVLSLLYGVQGNYITG